MLDICTGILVNALHECTTGYIAQRAGCEAQGELECCTYLETRPNSVRHLCYITYYIPLSSFANNY